MRSAWVVLLGALTTVGCKDPYAGKFTQPMTLAGKQVPAAVLNAGQHAYMLHCRACHGDNGDGQGPASAALRPPPRDLRLATYKFSGVVDGLPHDADLRRILERGLTGTAMLAWDIPGSDFDAILQYIKTFSPDGEGFRDPDQELGRSIKITKDPWKTKEEAVARGETIYHGFAGCWSCHPAYAKRDDIRKMSVAMVNEGLRSGGPITEFRSDMYQSEAKPSETYKAGDVPMKILPPNFLYNEVRSVSRKAPERAPEDLFRVIASGIPGTAMPAWKGALPDREIWAMAHYIDSLLKMRGTTQSAELRNKLFAAGSHKKAATVD